MSALARGSIFATLATQSEPARGMASPTFGQDISEPSAAQYFSRWFVRTPLQSVS